MHSGSHWALHRNHTINALGAYTGSAHGVLIAGGYNGLR
eukprot:SAG11_NODE_459_length_9261_cov_7.747463_5_plen_39_part_00